MAVEEINAAGGVLGKKLRLFTEDDQSKAGEAATVVRKMISPASTNPKVTQIGDYIFRICFIDPFQGTVLSKFALNRGWKRVAVLTDVKQDYSVGLSQYFIEHFKANGGTVVAEQSYSSGDSDFNAQLTSLKSASPEAILVSGYYTEAGLIARQARQLGLTVPLLGGDGWDSPSLVEVAGTAMEGNFFSNHFSVEDPAPRIQDFVKKYQAKYGGTPDAMAALGYDSAMILADAIKRAGTTDAQPLRDALAKSANFDAITGNITLDEQRNAQKSAVILTIKDSKFRYVETVAP
jgi:branched-chain amino acid transport system substrate-binding protein